MEPSDISRIIAALIGALGAIIAAVLAVWLRRVPPEKTKEKNHLRNWVIGISVFAIAGFLYLAWSLSQTRIVITYPTDSAKVELTETITGKSSNIPATETIWIVVYSHTDDKLYPHESEARIDPDGKWTLLKKTDIGALEDHGQKFDIIAFLVNEDGKTELERYFSFVERSGLEHLPKGMAEYDKITVTRK